MSLIVDAPHSSPTSPEEGALRGEPFGAEHLEQHARRLAESLVVVEPKARDRRFAARFDDNAVFLRTAYEQTSRGVRQGEPLTADAEWLLDNYYVVEEQLREIREDLPQRYYWELPKVATGEPRVYALALELLVHTDSALDEATIVRFILAFQSVAQLSIGEVWAVPIMLRLALVENLRRLTGHMLTTSRCRHEARRLIAQVQEHEDFPLDVSSLQNCAPLAVELLQQLQDLGSDGAARLKRLARQLDDRQFSVQELTRHQNQFQAVNQVSIGNVITSMRLISALDWISFFERTNAAEQVLRNDPAEIYPQMDFESRDRYRHAVEQLAKRTKQSDVAVAEEVVQCAEAVLPRADKRRHVGYWLVDRGRSALERQLGYWPTGRERITRSLLAQPEWTYFSLILLFTLLAAALMAAAAWMAGLPAALFWLVLLLALLPASELAISGTNLVITLWLPPRLLPKLEFREGVPQSCTTFVVIPSLIGSLGDVRSLLEQLEKHYLTNAEPALRFALLTDLTDAAQQHMPGDEPLVGAAVAGIRDLNVRYGGEGREPFYLFHRERRWNPSEKRWMGWERKRGKLMEFNRLLHGAADTSYVVVEGDRSWLAPSEESPLVKFVITLDADTQLPYGTARRLIGALAHPLNRARYDPSRCRVTEGYAVLQPRIGVQLTSASRTLFARIFAPSPGIDPYTSCASDVYQDLFGEASFIGKGIYDLEVFEKALSGVFRENQILSHDLIEGCHARVGLASDIELIDSFPTRYDAEARRHHRWIRGDWQILPWLLPRVPVVGGWRRNPLTVLSRWKIFDNLRRSLVQPAILTLLVGGWLAWPALAWLWTLAAMLVLVFPLLTQIGLAVRGWPWTVSWLHQARSRGADLGRSLVQTILSIVFLPHQAIFMLDAVLRTLFRMLISRRRLLEWETAAATELRLHRGRWSTLIQMWPVMVVVIGGGLLLSTVAWPAAAPLLAAWLVSPAIAHWLSRPLLRPPAQISPEQKRWLRSTARRTWAFYETWVGPETHWLPPDNVQEYPSEKIAQRVSPTNEGLFLASALAARDFGYIGLTELADLWERSLTSLCRLDRLNGHFYNWYDTLTLQPLLPRYVSTVDSGNLAACFLTIAEGIAELRSGPTFSAVLWQGLSDTIDMAEEACEALHPRGARIVLQPLEDLSQAIAELRKCGTTAPVSLLAWQQALAQLGRDREQLVKHLEVFSTSTTIPATDAAPKVTCLVRRLDGLLRDWRHLLAWVDVAAQLAPRQSQIAAGERAPALPWRGISPHTQELWQQLWISLASRQSLAAARSLDEDCFPQASRLRTAIAGETDAADKAAALAWSDALIEAIQAVARQAALLDQRLGQLAEWMERLAGEMDFRFLFNSQRRLFAIGYNLEDGKLDRAHYDMLCSEARLASFLAIAKGDVDAKHWFQLGRPLTHVAGRPGLLSWGGTMFEYLMPHLFQNHYAGSLLMESCQAAVARQQNYGRQLGVPWGVSESAFGALAVNSDYHYRSFGVPGLGLKRGLGKDLVVSPYSTMLALDIDPAAAVSNLQELAAEGGRGAWGMYDAIDFTPDRLPAGKRSLIVRCYMAHHHGMSLLAMANWQFSGCFRRRFHAHPLARASDLLLQERVPRSVPLVEPHADEIAEVEIPRAEDELVSRRLVGVDAPAPRTNLLANGQYSLMLTASGGGYSRWRDVAVTRWRSDPTRDDWGQFLYLRDVQSSRIWSATYQPTCVRPDSYEVIFAIDKAEFHRRDFEIESHLEVVVSPENDAEIRQLTITNDGSQARQIEVTSYVEPVLNSQGADLAHPAFHKLFIETEYVAEEAALLAHRRPRGPGQEPLWAVHVLACGAEAAESIQYETSRQRFLGRDRSPRRPAALDAGGQLTGQVGAVLDPVLALRCRVRIPPHESVTLGFTTAVATSREAALALADQYHDLRGVQRALELAWAFNQVQLRQLHLSPAKAHLYQRVAGALIYPDANHRGSLEMLLANRQGQSGLWRHGISGDLPLVLVHVTHPEHVALVRELLAAHAYWQSHGLAVELVILNDYPGSYLDALQEQLLALLSDRRQSNEPKASLFLLRGAQLPHEDKALLEAAAHIVLHGERGTLSQQWDAAARSVRPAAADQELPGRQDRKDGGRLRPLPAPTNHVDREQEIKRLEFWNGLGGFALDGREYRILLTAGTNTPLPWSNVIANPVFGTLITSSGGGYTWHINSRENKLTAWSNDPVSDPPAEMLYVRDEATGEYWSPLPAALRDDGDYWIHHGQGYSRFLHTCGGIEHDVLISIAPDDPVKFVRVRLRNKRPTARQLSLTYFAQWVLGVSRDQSQLHIQTAVDAASGALIARNRYHPELPGQEVFLHALTHDRSWTGDRAEFLGRHGDLDRPRALRQRRLSGWTGVGRDPCGAVQARVQVASEGEAELVFLLGAGCDASHARELLAKYSTPAAVRRAREETASRWDDVLGAVQVKTPNRALDLLTNRWLVYQTLSCRIWGRSAFYQSGGAFGFRDQLQDVMALVYSRPDLARGHLLRAASRQFEEGDVQHWWHPPSGRGTRTRFSDDFLWLPLVACHYIRTTGDVKILDEQVPFLKSPLLEPHEHERYEQPAASGSSATLYDHCRRAIEHGFRTGSHGLPLMGCGDWNDGMNRVGELGLGESVWVGWMQLVVLRDFVPIAQARGDDDAVRLYKQRASHLREALERHAWDGQWYRRAYFDDGTPLGSASNDECQIDSISQTWAVLAEADPQRTRQAIQAVLKRLVRREDRLVLLLTPPFDQTALEPGYIKGYLPGVRENGGQYTHSALWLILALARLRRGTEALGIYDLIQPVRHAATPGEVARYQVEPYVVAADIYGLAPHVGRGGWTWYTGSAAWMYRVTIEALLGLEIAGDRLRINPCLPPDWQGYELTLRRGRTSWRVIVNLAAEGDSTPGGCQPTEIQLIDDGQSHEVVIECGRC